MSFVRRMSLKNDSNFQNLLNPALWKLKRIFDDHKKELRIAGGKKCRKRSKEVYRCAPRLIVGQNSFRHRSCHDGYSGRNDRDAEKGENRHYKR